jgi:hypothetical protein
MQLNIFDKKIEAKQIDSKKLLELAEYNVDLNNFEEVSKEEFFATVGQLNVSIKVLCKEYPYSNLWIEKSIDKVVGVTVEQLLEGKWPPVEYYFKLRNFDFNKYKP